MKALLVSLLLLPGLALGQFLPTSSSVTLNLDFSTDLNVDLIDFGVADGGTLHVQGTTYSAAGEIPTLASDLFNFGTGDGGTLHISGPLFAGDATIADDFVCTDDAEVGGLFSVAGVASFGVADAGTVHVSGTSYLGALEVTGTSAFGGVLSFGVADGGTLHVSGGAYAADFTCSDDAVVGDALTVTGASNFNGVASFDIADGGTLHLSGTGYLGAVAVAGASTLTGVTTFGVADGGTLHVSGTLYALDAEVADDLLVSDAINASVGNFNEVDAGWVHFDFLAGHNVSAIAYIPTICSDPAYLCDTYITLDEGPSFDMEMSVGPAGSIILQGDDGFKVTLDNDGGINNYAVPGLHVGFENASGIHIGSIGMLFVDTDIAWFKTVDAGTVHAAAGYVTTGEIPTLASDLFSFGIADGGTFHLSGPAFVDDLTTADDLTVTDDLLVSGIASVADVFSFGVADGGTLHVAGAAYVSDLNAADDVTAADALNVAGLATIVTLDAGVAYAGNFRSPASNVPFGTWLMDSDSSGPAVEDRNMMGPLYVSANPGRFGEVTCNWEAAGTGGTTGVVVSIYNVTDTSVLCSCTLGACTTTAFDPLRCSCSQNFLAAKVYVGRVTTATDCAANPTKIHCTVEVLR